MNQDSICDLLQKIRKSNAGTQKIYLVLDGAAYNKAKSVKKRAKELRIIILYLPPYSPNLNPIERLWKFMKKKVTANQYYEEFTDLERISTQVQKNI